MIRAVNFRENQKERKFDNGVSILSNTPAIRASNCKYINIVGASCLPTLQTPKIASCRLNARMYFVHAYKQAEIDSESDSESYGIIIYGSIASSSGCCIHLCKLNIPAHNKWRRV